MEKILLLESIHSGAQEILEERGWSVDCEKTAFSGDELVERAQGYQAIGIRSKTNLTSDFFKRCPDLQVAGAFCIGTNQVDLVSSNILGCPVFNAPYSNTRSVAELVISHLVALSRRVFEISTQAHKGVWQKSAFGSHEVRGKVLGIVGYGHIGSQLSILAEALGMRVRYFDVLKKLPLGNAASVETLQDLLAQSDFVSLHVPETPMTQNLITADEISVMKPGAFLINASRGSVVDIPALAKALKEQRLAGAAVDVYPVEPKNNKEKFQSELQGLSNVILTPHIGGSTEEAQAAIGLEVAESISNFLLLGATSGAVNFPALDLPPLSGDCRILNVHKNVPGVLSAINNIVSETGVNIRAQFLSTDSEIGYLALDLEGRKGEGIELKIQALADSIRTRRLLPPPQSSD